MTAGTTGSPGSDSVHVPPTATGATDATARDRAVPRAGPRPRALVRAGTLTMVVSIMLLGAGVVGAAFMATGLFVVTERGPDDIEDSVMITMILFSMTALIGLGAAGAGAARDFHAGRGRGWTRGLVANIGAAVIALANLVGWTIGAFAEREPGLFFASATSLVLLVLALLALRAMHDDDARAALGH